MKRLFASMMVGAAVISGVALTGSPAGATVGHNPLGHADGYTQTLVKYGDGRTSVYGWAGDPDLGPVAGITIRVYVDGRYAISTYTHLSRPDVQRVYPQFGPDTGFSTDVPMSVGTHNVCVYAINRGAGYNANLGCAMREAFDPAYVAGHIDSITVTATSPQTIRFTGWALDPTDYSTRLLAAVVSQGRFGASPDPTFASFTTGLARPDVTRVYAGRNPNSGFTVVWTQRSNDAAFVSGQPTCIYLWEEQTPVGQLYARAPVCTTFP